MSVKAPFITAPALTMPGIAHGFFGRAGGVSSGIFASLNCGFGSADDPACVAENRARCARALSLTPENVITIYQIHSADVMTVEKPWRQGEAPRGDAMVTNVPGIGLGILAADCAPILAADPVARVIGAAHAGWKGAIGGIAEAMLTRMIALGASLENLRVAIGPSISAATYEVGPEFRARFVEEDADNAAFFAPSVRPDHFMFDLSGYVGRRLARFGVINAPDKSLAGTYDGPYFSFRRTTHAKEPDYGRNLSLIALCP